MRARKFDTLQYANSLKDAGVESKAAEAIARGQAAANEDIMANIPEHCDLVTKADLKAELANFATKNDILQLESRLENKIVDTRLDIERVEAKLELKIADVRSDVRDVLTVMKGTEDRLVIKLGAIIVVTISAAIALNHFFHIFI